MGSLHGLSRSTMPNRNDNTVKGIIRNENGNTGPLAGVGRILLATAIVMVGLYVSGLCLVFHVHQYQDAATKKRVNTYYELKKEKRETQQQIENQEKKLYKRSMR
jgi:Ca2+/H+ antiporter